MSLVAAVGAIGVLLIYAGITSPRRTEMPRRAIPSGRAVGAALGTAVGSWLVALGVGARPAPAMVVAVLAAWVVLAAQHARHHRSERSVREAWPDAIADLISSVRAGVSMAEACMYLGRDGPDPLRAGFDRFARVYRSTANFEAALDAARGSFADPVADRVLAALNIAHQVGGTDLIAYLRTLGEFVSSDLVLRREIEARWSWTVTAARIAAAAPWIVLLLMATRPEAARAYSSSTGAWVIVGGAVATIVGYQAMLAAGRLPRDRRLS